jgi:hypothetical protein
MKKGEKRGRQWMRACAKLKAVPQSLKDDLTAKAQELIERELKPLHIKPPPENIQWNYIIDIFTRWRGPYFYFMARYACPSPNAVSPIFEVGFARMEYLRSGNFNLAYMRHTGHWWQIFNDVPMEEALQAVCSEPFFQP